MTDTKHGCDLGCDTVWWFANRMSYGHLIKYLNMTLVVVDRNYRKSRRVGPAATTVMDFGLYSGRCAMIEPHSVLTLGCVTNKRLHHIGLK